MLVSINAIGHGAPQIKEDKESYALWATNCRIRESLFAVTIFRTFSDYYFYAVLRRHSKQFELNSDFISLRVDVGALLYLFSMHP